MGQAYGDGGQATLVKYATSRATRGDRGSRSHKVNWARANAVRDISRIHVANSA
jgi:hypothetical protein